MQIGLTYSDFLTCGSDPQRASRLSDGEISHNTFLPKVSVMNIYLCRAQRRAQIFYMPGAQVGKQKDSLCGPWSADVEV